MKNTTRNKVSAQKVTRLTSPVVASKPREIKNMTEKKCAATYEAAFAKMEASRRYLAEN